MTQIERMHSNGRMSRIVIHGDTIYLCGQVGNADSSVADQTRETLAKIEGLLAEAGSDKTRILQATIRLASMDDFAEMNAIWDAWVVPGTEPARACGEAELARPELKVEIIITAAR
ncbi:RidA family protein [Shimia marina]|uniref:Enamine/imine deaminase n=1 Tax=Shimia marina TaxID=321267 RepID=A0A0P1EL54_9RHOB|nr:RidA family protein [Shimia marina]CUH51163.1 Enamine/imine deaminase [Shimia marina]SFD56328.1 Enamine deaminase RidA, house cleaning of reactive enamine intermediates, YjgF/YER057c/UK114 family [Shimia marina]